MLLVLLVCAAPVIASYFTYFVIRPEGRSNYGTLIVPSRSMPAELPLADLDGRPVSRSLRGQWLLVVVGLRLRRDAKRRSSCSASCARCWARTRAHRQGLARHR